MNARALLFASSIACAACAGAPPCDDRSPRAASAAPRAAPTTPERAALRIAVTFDDLPSHGPALPGEDLQTRHARLLDALEKHGVPQAYGFVNGKGDALPGGRASLELWKRRGHPLGNHTFSHLDVGEVGAATFIEDIDRNDALLAQIMGDDAEARRQRRMFRYPYLRQGRDAATVDAVRSHLAQNGYRIAEVTIDFYDWAYNPPFVRCQERGSASAVAALHDTFLISADAFLRWSEATSHAIFGRSIPHVLLLHAGTFDAHMLDELLTRYEKAGAKWITLEEALADGAYARDIRQPGKYWFGWLEKIVREDEVPQVPAPFEADALLEQLCR